MMNRTLSSVALFTATAALSAAAWAGYRYPIEVQIDTANRTAKGALGSARASADNNQAIGCRVGASAGSSSPVAYCFAVDASGCKAECSSSDAAILAAVSTLRDSSILSFGWSPGGACLSVTVENYSSNPPLQP
ncbi:MAG TPA: hypothetical protein VFS43_15360 [Polyangiaceae bacterium]|nr:hypothetical protein [Polyangiaceae bacterium]